MAANTISRCAVDNLPEAQRKHVIDQLLAGVPLRKVAAPLNISHVSLGAYRRKVLLPTIKAAGKFNAIQEMAQTPTEQAEVVTSLTRAVISAGPILSRIAEHRKVVDSKISKATPAGAASLMNADLKGLELEARLTGLLDNSAGGSSLTVVCGDVYVQQADTGEDQGEVIDITPTK